MTDAPAGRPRFSIIIPTRHRDDMLAACLDLLTPKTQSLPADTYEVVVTDDGSTSTAEAMLRERYPWVRWVAGPRRGPAANRNNGVKHAQGEWLIFVDDDCLPSAGWVKAFIDAIHPGVLIYEGRTICSKGIRTALESAPINENGGWLWSCNMMVHRTAFATIGGFDEAFPTAHLEDVDLRERLKIHGYTFDFVRDAWIDHPPRRHKFSDKFGAIAQSDVLMYYKHPEMPQYAHGSRGSFRSRLMFYIFKCRVRRMLASPFTMDTVIYAAMLPKEFLFLMTHIPKWEKQYQEMFGSRVGGGDGADPQGQPV